MRQSSRFRELFEDFAPELLILAHRGESSLAPENTLEAAELGKRSRAVGWELDVHVSRDGVPVVIHDESLLRTTDVAARFSDDPRAASGFLVADFDLWELKTLDAGSWFTQPEGGSRSALGFGTLDQISATIRQSVCQIPTLEEALAWTVENDWLVNVELKSFPNLDPRLTQVAIDTIRRMGVEDRVLVSSFDHREMSRVVESAPDLATAALCATPIGRSWVYAREVLGVDALHVSGDVLGASSLAYRRDPRADSLAIDELRSLREHNIPVLVYTVNDPVLAAHFFEAGVAGVFSDRPGFLRDRSAHG